MQETTALFTSSGQALKRALRPNGHGLSEAEGQREFSSRKSPNEARLDFRGSRLFANNDFILLETDQFRDNGIIETVIAHFVREQFRDWEFERSERACPLE